MLATLRYCWYTSVPCLRVIFVWSFVLPVCLSRFTVESPFYGLTMALPYRMFGLFRRLSASFPNWHDNVRFVCHQVLIGNVGGGGIGGGRDARSILLSANDALANFQQQRRAAENSVRKMDVYIAHAGARGDAGIGGAISAGRAQLSRMQLRKYEEAGDMVTGIQCSATTQCSAVQ